MINVQNNNRFSKTEKIIKIRHLISSGNFCFVSVLCHSCRQPSLNELNSKTSDVTSKILHILHGLINRHAYICNYKGDNTYMAEILLIWH